MNHQDMYRQLAMKLHPDRGGSLEEMTRLNSAYQSQRWQIVETLYSKYFVVRTKARKQTTQRAYKPINNYTIAREVMVRRKYRKKVYDLFKTVEAYAKGTGASVLFHENREPFMGRSQFVFIATNMNEETWRYLQEVFADLSYGMQ